MNPRSRRGLAVLGLLALAPGAALTHRLVEQQDHIEFAGNLTTGAEPVVLFDGWRDGECKNDEILVEAGLQNVGDASQADTPDCRALVVAFARGYAPAVVRPPDWQDAGSGNQRLRVQLPPELTVSVGVWVVTDATGSPPEPVKFAEESFQEANAVLYYNRAGIALKLRGVVTPLPRADGLAKDIGAGCGHVDAVRARPDYVANQLNVYFVSTIRLPATEDGIDRTEEDALELGRNCVAYGAPEIIYIDYDDAGPGTLAHEIGHALGLWEPYGGHTDKVPGLRNRNNAMLDGFTDADGHLSLGQVFRMQFDSRSWLNRRGVERPFVLTCQASVAEEWPCPKLARDVPRGD